MSKIPRPTISMNGSLHARLSAYCEANSIAVSRLVESLLEDLEGGAMPRERTEADQNMAWRSGRTKRGLAPALAQVIGHGTAFGQGEPRLRDRVPLHISAATFDLVADSLEELPPVRGKPPDRSHEMSAAFDRALVRMLDTYELVAERATHCAICRVRSKNARPFVPLLAGEGVVAVCKACVREGRTLAGLRRAV